MYQAAVSTKLVMFVGLGLKFFNPLGIANAGEFEVSGMVGMSSARIFWNSLAEVVRTAGSSVLSKVLNAASSAGFE